MSANLHEVAHKLPLDENIDFRGLLQSFWEYKKLIASVTFATMLCGTIYTLSKAPQYESNVILQVENKSQNHLGIGSTLGSLSGVESDPSAVQKALIKSRVILEPVVKQLGLDVSLKEKRKLFARASDTQPLINQFNVPAAYYDQPLTLTFSDTNHFELLSPLGNLLAAGETNKLVSSDDKRVSLKITMGAAKPNSTFSVLKHPSLNAVYALLPKLRIEPLGNDGSSPATGLLQVSMQGTDPQKITTILNAIADVTVEKDAETKARETAKTIEFLNYQIPLVKEALAQAETQLNQYRATSGKIDIRFETQQALAQLTAIEKQITQTSLKKVDLLQQFTPIHPLIIQMSDKLKELHKEKAILETRIKSLPASDQITVNLMRDVKVKNDLYLILLNKIQQLQVIKAGTVSDIHVLAPAMVPDAPLSKKTGVVITASFLLGFILSCLFVLARKALFSRVTDPRWLEQHLHITNLAIVPYSKQQFTNMSRFKNKLTQQLEILAAKYPQDLSIEALRSLRTNLQIMLCESRNNIISIMGVSPGIGKSFISLNFAYLLADIGKRVLLIDGDIRKGHLNNYFNLNRGPGLSEILKGTATLEQALHKVSSTNFNFLSCGEYPLNPADILAGDNLAQLLQTASQQFDIVLIDTAPVLAVTDSTLIAAHSGLNFLLIGSDKHQTDEITAAVKRVTHAGIKINGTIFNNLKNNTNTHGNYHYHYQAEPQQG